MSRSPVRSKVLLAHMSVDLGRLQAGMTQQLLHYSQVGTPVQQVGRIAVPERVRMGRRGGPVVQNPSHITGAQPAASLVEKECVGGSVVVLHSRPAPAQPGLYGVGGRFAQR